MIPERGRYIDARYNKIVGIGGGGLSPADYNLTAWTNDPEANGGAAPAISTIVYYGIVKPKTSVIANLWLEMIALGVTPVANSNKMALFDINKVKLAETADMGTAWSTGTAHRMVAGAITSQEVVVDDPYIVAFTCNFTTPPTFTQTISSAFGAYATSDMAKPYPRYGFDASHVGAVTSIVSPLGTLTGGSTAAHFWLGVGP